MNHGVQSIIKNLVEFPLKNKNKKKKKKEVVVVQTQLFLILAFNIHTLIQRKSGLVPL